MIFKEGPKDAEAEYRPTILLDAGLGCWSLIYASLIDELSSVANVVAFDRFGYGYSSYKRSGNRLVDATNSLTQVLQRLGLEGPFIYVAHSMGGAYANHFARKKTTPRPHLSLSHTKLNVLRRQKKKRRAQVTERLCRIDLVR